MTDAHSWSRSSVLVTGAGGFLGSWLVSALADRGADVVAILRDAPAQSNFRQLGLHRRVSVVAGSITDAALVARTVNEYEVDSCFHVAAQAIVGPANRSPLSTFESNIRGTWSVLEACRTSARVDRVVVASSDKAYGAQPVLPYNESMPLLGSSPYEASKVATELMVRTYHGTYGTPIAVTRCANIYGPGDFNWSRLVPGTIRSVLRGENPIVRSDGTPVRDYLHVDDAVAGYLVLAEQLHRSDVVGRAFNLGTDQPRSAIDVIRLIIELAGARGVLEPDIRGGETLAGEIDRQFLDSTLAGTTLGWRASVPFEDGLRRTIDWYRAFLGRGAGQEPLSR